MSQLAELKTIYPEYEHLQYEDLLKGINKATLIKLSTYLIGKNLFSGEQTSFKTRCQTGTLVKLSKHQVDYYKFSLSSYSTTRETNITGQRIRN